MVKISYIGIDYEKKRYQYLKVLFRNLMADTLYLLIQCLQDMDKTY
jgi:hypothetical protein